MRALIILSNLHLCVYRINSYILWTQKGTLIIRFEKEVKIKVQQKIKGNSKEDTILKSAFKFFDTLNSGCVDRPNFCKACEKLGVFIDAKVSPLPDTGNNIQQLH